MNVGELITKLEKLPKDFIVERREDNMSNGWDYTDLEIEDVIEYPNNSSVTLY